MTTPRSKAPSFPLAPLARQTDSTAHKLNCAPARQSRQREEKKRVSSAQISNRRFPKACVSAEWAACLFWCLLTARLLCGV
eukprot:scaffold474_cov169-Ochromonas_danica.AAC.4